jgi:predicted HTH transcriptional regulator
VSLPRNPLLAATARTMGLGEQIGRGLAIIRRTVAQGIQIPVEIATTQNDVLLIIPSALQHPLGSSGMS